MLLAIDIGNSRVKVGWREPDGPVESLVLGGVTNLHSILDRGIDFVAIASVVPAHTPKITNLLGERGIPFQDLNAGNAPGLEVLYETPETVGADRVANALFLSRGPLPAILVDFGTATKLDVVDSRGAFLGGAILPGAAMMARSLVAETAKLPEIELAAPPSAIGRNTQGCLQSGTVLALAKAVDGLIDAFTEELGVRPSVVSTGGAAELVAPLTACAAAIEPHATLIGLLEAAVRWTESG